jgi:hypothetical protein
MDNSGFIAYGRERSRVDPARHRPADLDQQMLTLQETGSHGMSLRDIECPSQGMAAIRSGTSPSHPNELGDRVSSRGRRPTHKYTAEIDCRSVMAVLEVAQQHPGLGVGSRAASCACFSGHAEPLATRCRAGRQGQRQHLRLGTVDPSQGIGGDPYRATRRPPGFAPKGGQVDLAHHGRHAPEVTARDQAEALHAREGLCLERRRHACAEEFNGAHQRRVRQRREVQLKR